MNGHFAKETVRILAKRAGERCSLCKVITALPNSDSSKHTNLGEAAHIKGRREGPNLRFDSSMADNERASIDNGIWLCGTCHKLIDSDSEEYTVARIEQIKTEHAEYMIALFEGQGEIEGNQIREHDRAIFQNSEVIFSETDLNSLLETLINQSNIHIKNLGYTKCHEYIDYHNLVSNRYVTSSLNEKWDTLHYHLSRMFMVLYNYKNEPDPTNLGYIGLAPSPYSIFNLGIRTSFRGIARQIVFKRELKDAVDSVKLNYKEYRLEIKNSLIV